MCVVWENCGVQSGARLSMRLYVRRKELKYGTGNTVGRIAGGIGIVARAAGRQCKLVARELFRFLNFGRRNFSALAVCKSWQFTDTD